MEYSNIITIVRKDKEIVIFLREGETLSLENIVDIETYPQYRSVECMGEYKLGNIEEITVPTFTDMQLMHVNREIEYCNIVGTINKELLGE